MPFYPPNRPKNQNFKKMKKRPGEIIIFIHVYQKLWLDDDMDMVPEIWCTTDGQTDGWKK